MAFVAGIAIAQTAAPITVKKGQVEYHADERGNKILDYSQCGYRQSDAPLPEAQVAVFVSHATGDQSARIQRAIDYVSSLKADAATGLRGAVLLDKGVFMLSEPLRISASGVVLRGTSKSETVLFKQGVDRGAAVYVEGKHDRQILDTLRITDAYVPVGKKAFTVSASQTLPSGSFGLLVVRPSTKEWIASIGCDQFGGNLGYWGWKPGEMDITWDRTATASGNAVTIDVPLSIALDKQWGEPYALRYVWPGRISESGVENLTIVSDTPDYKVNRHTEDHCWDGVYIDAAEDCWVRMVDFRGLAGSAVIVQPGAQQVTVEDCCSRQPISEIGGWRRRTFLTLGGKTLFQRCYSEEGINDFTAGFCAPGPNAFVQCDAVGTHGYSGSCASWATGLLFDNVNIEGGAISFKNMELDRWGAGWNTANSMMWQCSASKIECYDAAPDARCYAIGCWSYCVGDGFWLEVNNHVNPRSLFLTQLTARRGSEAAEAQCRLLMRNLDGSTSPTYERAAQMAAEALNPRVTMEQWIADAKFTPSVDRGNAKCIDDIKQKKAKTAERNMSVPVVENGKLLVDGALMAGTFHRTPWWNGRPRYSNMMRQKDAVTRFVPGAEHQGGTNRIDSVVANIQRNNTAVWNQNYGLWYDRRRDDHERIKRITGDVWPPFFEQSIARSGEGKAWDGLSLYDLTRLNAWYFYRVNKLAEAVPQTMIINQHYFQHNILEAGAHWVDAPWRSANNIQSTGENKGKGTKFLEPVPFTGDKRIFTADLFYDISDAERAAIYKQYIWNVLDATAENENIYQSVSEEYTGPQHFTEFWLRCIAEWEAKTGRNARVVLNANKNVTDAVMAQKDLAAVVDVIEIEQWFYHGQKLYAPEGGKNLAPRQHMRLTKTGNPNAHDIYRTVAETHRQNPAKAVVYYAKAYDRAPWAVVFAGGSCPHMKITDATLAKALATMRPVYSTFPNNGVYEMEGDAGKMIYNLSGSDIDAPNGKAFVVNQKDGTLKPLKAKRIPANAVVWVK